MLYKIGEKVQGGIVFCVWSNGAHGLVAAEKDQSAGAFWDDAIKICSELELGKFRDWFLPSKGLLELMYNNLQTQGLGGFVADTYWSSTELGSVFAWFQDFDNGSQSNFYDTNVSRSVRAARAL